MKLGVSFPQLGIPADPGAVRAFAQGVEALGFDYLMISDHILGAGPLPGVQRGGGFSNRDQFLDPITTFAFLAGVTTRLNFTTGIIILGQRQAALVAKQAAMVDVLSGGRLRLGVGLGRNEFEYEALGMEFHNRGARCEEQIAVLRALWTQEVVTFKGRWHTINAAGLNPMPIQRPIPILLGGTAESVLRRVGRLADGWIATRYPASDERMAAMIERIRGYAKEAGRDPAHIEVEGRVMLARVDPAVAAHETHLWERLGASHAGVNTWDSGRTEFKSPEEHLAALERYLQALR